MSTHQNLHANYIVEDGKLKISEVSKEILGLKKHDKKIENIQDFDNRIKDVLSGICFSSKRINFDEFTKQQYDDEVVFGSEIIGARNEFIYPRGIVFFNQENRIFFDVANIIYNVEKKFLPTKYLDFSNEFDKNNIIIPRSNGKKQNGKIVSNSGLKISRTRGGLYLYVSFLNEEDKLDYEKHISIDDFTTLNKILEFTINIPKLNINNYDFTNYNVLTNELINEIISYYNKISENFYKTFVLDNFNNFDFEVIEDDNSIKFILSKS